MNKTAIYTILTIVKVLIIIPSMLIVFSNLMLWLKNSDKKKLKKALIVFACLFFAIIALTAIEFIVAYN
ncbi:hypothetical protein ACFQZS_15440 [Mucilaginibacter calamicampi]|uniref:Uncharacterized protein n=1 Tax=Mucilaginibacter calamicampi TaxID=1302352 RepID=A0ABW2Z0G9_9SPHI